MLRRLSVLLALPLALLLVTGTALAAPGGPIGKGQLNRNACGTVGKVVIDVNQKVLNDADQGSAGNAWAFDTYNKHIQVWPTSANTWCAVVTWNGGKFAAIPGATSPGGTNIITGAKVKGEFSGGYRATFTGTLLATPLWRTHGNVGTFNYACDISFVCPGYVDWLAQYFNAEADSTFTYAWWGWSYQASDHHGSWITSSDVVTSGDIF
jgi:hypothetical protein